MSWFSKWFGHPAPKPPSVVIPPVVRTTIRVEVFDGDKARDEKIPGALVSLGTRITPTDGAGNAIFTDVAFGRYVLIIHADGFTPFTATIEIPGPLQFELEREVPPVGAWTTDGHSPYFLQGGQPTRYKGVSQFRLLDRFAQGADLTDVFDAYQGFNVFRVWPYCVVPGFAWNPPDLSTVINFHRTCLSRGVSVEYTLLTDDDAGRWPWARTFVQGLAASGLPGILLEIGNEPITNGKRINTSALDAVCRQSGFPFSSGDYEDSDRWFGTYYTCHTGRTRDWTRRAHDLYDFYIGEGPEKRTHPHRVPCVGDEPGKPEDVGSVLTEWRAYFGACSLLGGGATVHTNSGKQGLPPTDAEKPLIATALEAMNAFPATAPLGEYRRIVEPGQGLDPRTYVVGNNMVRCQQQGADAPEPGWQPIEPSGVLWRR